MKFILIYGLTLIPSLAFAVSPTAFHITPLDSTTRDILKNRKSNYKIVEFEQEEKEFHAKAWAAYDLAEPLLKANAVVPDDPLQFVYDCLFLRAPKNRDQKQACEKVTESFKR